MTWYIVLEDRSRHEESEEETAEAKVWTLSRDPTEPGWQTDGGYDGYGLTKANAQFLCDAANEKEAQDGRRAVTQKQIELLVALADVMASRLPSELERTGRRLRRLAKEIAVEAGMATADDGPV